MINPYAQSFNPYPNYGGYGSYPSMPQTYGMPQVYSPATDPFTNAAAWRAAMPTPNLTFNYNMGAGQSSGYNPYQQPTSPYGQVSQYGQQYPSYQQYGQYPQANQFNPYAQQQYNPYGQTAGAYPYGQTNYGLPNPYGGDMFNPTGGMPGMDALNNPATTNVDNLTPPAPPAVPEKKSSLMKWVVGLGVAAAAAWGISAWVSNGNNNNGSGSKDKLNLKSNITGFKNLQAFNTAKDKAKIAQDSDAHKAIEAALAAHTALAGKLADDAKVDALTTENGPIAELTKAHDAFHEAAAKVGEASGKDGIPAEEQQALIGTQEALQNVHTHLDNLMKLAKGEAEEETAE